jgi:hypothetical protein
MFFCHKYQHILLSEFSITYSHPKIMNGARAFAVSVSLFLCFAVSFSPSSLQVPHNSVIESSTKAGSRRGYGALHHD